MQHSVQEKSSLYVPNWLIALELGAGAALLYISSSALVTTDMHLSRSSHASAPIEMLEAVASKEEKIILSAHSGETFLTE